MLKANNIQKSYGVLNVLSDISFSIGQGQKIALVGHNGTGKTTLLKIVAGLEKQDAGEIELTKGIRIGYLPQDTSLSGKETISEYLRRITGIDLLEQEIEKIQGLSGGSEKETKYSQVYEEYELLDGYAFKHLMEIMLSGFGLENISLEQSLINLSSGQKSKVVLAGILLKGVDLLLLDEPTNNLDLPALIWLEDFLQKTEASCIVVSHDRRFLDRVAKKIFEIDWHTRTLAITSGTYSNYLEMAAKQVSKQKEDYRIQQQEIERLSDQAREKRADSDRGSRWIGTDNDKFLRGFKRNQAGKSSRVAKTLEKRIEQMDKVEKPIERAPFEIPLEAEIVPGVLDIRLSEIVAGYQNGFSIGPLSLEIRYGERIDIMGLNGVGKSTLLKTITGHLPPLKGEIEVGRGVRIGNMMQEHDTLPRSQTLLDFLLGKTSLTRELVYAKLNKFGFSESQVKSNIGILSPGGRSRLLLALFSAQSVNMLVLDEPTNHLDLEALGALEEVLRPYQGTVLLVSHDRYFLENTFFETIYVLSDGVLTKIPDYKTYIISAEERAQKLLRLL